MSDAAESSAANVGSALAPPSRWRALLETLLIFGVFSLHGAWPVPDVNEAHYLSKAKHYWNHEWCQTDFFVNTADAHQVFYWTFGWLTRLLPLVAVAWIGRLLTWALLAYAWRRLSWAVLPHAWLAVLGAVLFVSLNENAHMAGEWIIGGVEAKGFAYVLVLLGIEAVVRARWNRAWLLLGAATGMHAVVGGWSLVAAGVAWLADRRERPTLKSMLPSLFGGFLLALPGVWYALALNFGVDAQTIADANPIYVWQRLPHHLAADHFQIGFPSRHLLLWALWLVLITVSSADALQRRLRWMVGGAMLLTVVGYAFVLIGNWKPDFAASLLRFYWFRMSDVFVPLGVTLVGLGWLRQMITNSASRGDAETQRETADESGPVPHDSSSPLPSPLEGEGENVRGLRKPGRLVDGGIDSRRDRRFGFAIRTPAGGIGVLRVAVGDIAGRQGRGLRRLARCLSLGRRAYVL